MKRAPLVLGMVVAVMACSDLLTPGPHATSIVVAIDTLQLAPDEVNGITITLLDGSEGRVLPSRVSWHSTDTAIVVVDDSGRVRGRGTGTAKVIVAADGLTDSVVVITRRDWTFVERPPNGCRLRSDGRVLCDMLIEAVLPVGTIAVVSNYGFGQCVLTSGGEIWCRGNDYYGALGDSLPVDSFRDEFGQLSGPSDYIQLAGNGGSNFCGLRMGGEVRCWGSDSDGEIGDDAAKVNRAWPVPVAGGLVFTSLATESVDPTMCGTSEGKVWCWGGYGKPGIPQPTTPYFGLVTVSAGEYHSCGIDPIGQAFCWGYNGEGELGRGSVGGDYDENAVPAAVATAVLFKDLFVLATGESTCGVSLAGEIWCWGDGRRGQLGASGLPRSAVPVQIVSSQEFASVHAGGSQRVCALTVGGAEYCWGGLYAINLDTKPEDLLPRRTPSPY